MLVAAPLAAGLDQLLGDPRRWPHPVQAMGAAIQALRCPLEHWAGDRPWRLRLAGVLITAVTVALSLAAGIALEWLAAWGWRQGPARGLLTSLPLLVGLASALAGRSLQQAVDQVLELLPPVASDPAAQGGRRLPPAKVQPASALPAEELEPARRQLAWIVGRDTEQLSEPEILRALAETASENAVDGLFAPLFWMLVGSALALAACGPWALASWGPLVPAGQMPPPPGGAWVLLPGPLGLAWGFKAASTLDSMLGYRRGRLRWLGSAGARLDDALTWIPCRLVALTLPLAAGRPRHSWRLFRMALEQGRPDPSPNAGVSQAAYALTARVRLGGVNRYGGETRPKPILAADQPAADRAAVARILALSQRLLLLWLLVWILGGLTIGAWRHQL